MGSWKQKQQHHQQQHSKKENYETHQWALGTTRHWRDPVLYHYCFNSRYNHYPKKITGVFSGNPCKYPNTLKCSRTLKNPEIADVKESTIRTSGNTHNKVDMLKTTKELCVSPGESHGNPGILRTTKLGFAWRIWDYSAATRNVWEHQDTFKNSTGWKAYQSSVKTSKIHTTNRKHSSLPESFRISQYSQYYWEVHKRLEGFDEYLEYPVSMWEKSIPCLLPKTTCWPSEQMRNTQDLHQVLSSKRFSSGTREPKTGLQVSANSKEWYLWTCLVSLKTSRIWSELLLHSEDHQAMLGIKSGLLGHTRRLQELQAYSRAAEILACSLRYSEHLCFITSLLPIGILPSYTPWLINESHTSHELGIVLKFSL